jgi:hypothetical protein
MKQFQRRGAAVQVQPLERLGGPIFAHDSRNPLNQFLPVSLHQLGLAFCRLVDHHIHRNLFSGFSIIHLQDVQNQTIICANYSTTQGFGASIITTRQRTCLSAFVGMVEGGIEHMDIKRSGSAIQEQLDGKTVDWMEKVSDEQYLA